MVSAVPSLPSAIRIRHERPALTAFALALLFALLGIAVLELAARACGLGRPLLYERTAYGYRVQPSQDVRRLGKRAYYNAFGLRSREIDAVPGPGVTRILCLGDSITFGSTATDQDDTYPAQLERLLSARGNAYEVLNASAAGWATENEEGWLAAHGLFGSRILVLQVASHDLFQLPAAGDIAGTHPAFPEAPPVLALYELWVRYLKPRITARLRDPGEELHERTAEDVVRTLASFSRIAERVHAAGGLMIAVFVEQPRGVEPEDNLMRHAKREFTQRARELGVPVVRPAERFEALGAAAVFYDNLHPNVTGNRVMAELVAEAIKKDELNQRITDTVARRREAGAR